MVIKWYFQQFLRFSYEYFQTRWYYKLLYHLCTELIESLCPLSVCNNHHKKICKIECIWTGNVLLCRHENDVWHVWNLTILIFSFFKNHYLKQQFCLGHYVILYQQQRSKLYVWLSCRRTLMWWWVLQRYFPLQLDDIKKLFN